MKKQYKTIGAILAALSMAGVVRAQDNRIELVNSTEGSKLMIERLVSEGYLIPLQKANWYQLDQSKLDLLEYENDFSRASNVVEMLRTIIGKNVDLRKVDIFKARMSSQDYPSTGK